MDRRMVSAPEPIVVELGEATWRLQGRVGERNVYQYLVASADRDELLLIDTGTSATPREVVIPALRQLGFSEDDLRVVVVTHPDVDHQGGLAGLREACANAVTCCGFADRAMVGDPEKLLSDRYGPYLAEHGIGPTEDEARWIRANYGARVEIEVTFAGGETVQVGERRLQVLRALFGGIGALALLPDEALRPFPAPAFQRLVVPPAFLAGGGPFLRRGGAFGWRLLGIVVRRVPLVGLGPVEVDGVKGRREVILRRLGLGRCGHAHGYSYPNGDGRPGGRPWCGY